MKTLCIQCDSVMSSMKANCSHVTALTGVVTAYHPNTYWLSQSSVQQQADGTVCLISIGHFHCLIQTQTFCSSTTATQHVLQPFILHSHRVWQTRLQQSHKLLTVLSLETSSHIRRLSNCSQSFDKHWLVAVHMLLATYSFWKRLWKP